MSKIMCSWILLCGQVLSTPLQTDIRRVKPLVCWKSPLTMKTSSRNVVSDLFKNVNKTLAIIHLEIIITDLYSSCFALVCTSAINQTLKIPGTWAVFKEKLPSSRWHSSISHHSCSVCCLWGRGRGRRWQASCLPTQKVHPPAAGGGLGAPWRICLVWPGMQHCPRWGTNHRGADKVLKITCLRSKIIKHITFCPLPTQHWHISWVLRLRSDAGAGASGLRGSASLHRDFDVVCTTWCWLNLIPDITWMNSHHEITSWDRKSVFRPDVKMYLKQSHHLL